ncbi:MAG: cell division protein FtsW [Candidatus Marinimicrobia bacterium]|jgi:cell division protein FtsW|nr:cell division protein FtsW [Candidatus Neomarinimicrobiota bacterium]MBT3617197.1 cell division protein FtsW [Candidatus Neomarinimicrobiota bacterium]MBT3829766.1 cell division protein FtsW [Candidatus Neomarinimicrobiota bacterium]MBT3997887.1 cell division protein FtsW [Candidatus Neomarinimicrobiota bacterium]MBT4281265.1 cell division protein FtsW [Candidatus Neomarinimicrobiota bacterium]
MKQLNIINKKYDRPLLIGIFGLCVIGTVMLYSASTTRSLNFTDGFTNTMYLQLHLKRLFVGIIALIFFTMFDYRKLKRIAPIAVVVSIVMLALTKIVYLIQGNTFPARWLHFGFMTLQTSELARFSLILFLASYIDRKRNTIKDYYNGFAPPIIVMGVITALIIIQPDFSTSVLISVIGMAMLFFGGARFSHILATTIGAITILIPAGLARGYRVSRWETWWSPENASSDAMLQISQSLISLGNGGLFGMGLGNSTEKNMFLPTPHTDFIFAIIGEEIGFLGTVAVLTLFLFLFQRGIKIAKETTDLFGVMVALGISFSFILYAFTNVAVVTNLVPTTGLPMPLVSYGGSGLVINMASLGILLNISQGKRSVNSRKGWSLN